MLRIVSIIFLFLNLSFANQTYYTQHQAGWHWYHDPMIKNKINLINKNPVAAMNNLQHQVKLALDKAILDPSVDNVKNYLELQSFVSKKSSEFTQTWQKVLLESPNLDYSLTHPITSLGRQVYLNQYQQKIEEAIYKFSQKYGLFFFYKADCPYCEMMAPVLKNFVDRYKISIIPVSSSNKFLKDFPASKVDNGQMESLKIAVFPALFAVNPKLRKLIPISYGFMSEDLLAERIFKIMHEFKGD